MTGTGGGPRVSVIIPCHNYARFLPEAVASLVAQTFRSWEAVIINDGSTDNTDEVAGSLIRKYLDHPIRLVTQHNQGLVATRNNGRGFCSGEFIMSLDADDLLEPEYLEALVTALDGDPDACVAYSHSIRFGTESGLMEHGPFLRNVIMKREGPPSCLLIRRSAWDMVGGYSMNMSGGFEDWDFQMKLYEAGCKGAVVARPLFRYRAHETSMITRTNKRALRQHRRLKLNHPGLYAPRLNGISPGLAKAFIWAMAWTRDPVSRFLYVYFRGVHDFFRRLKYGGDTGE